MGLIKKGLLWGLLTSSGFLVGIASVGFLFAKYPKQFTTTLKMNQQWVGEQLGWLLGLVPVVGDHLEAFVASHGGGVTLLVAEVALAFKVFTLIFFVIFARCLRRRSSHRS